MTEILFTTAFVITEAPDIAVKGDWVEFISQSGDGKIKRFMTRAAARAMVETLHLALQAADEMPGNVVSIRKDHD